MTLNSFIKDWNNTYPPSTFLNKRARMVENFEVEISKSGRPNTLRINSIRSLKSKSGKLYKIFNLLTEAADRNNFILSMAAQPFGWNREETPSKDKIKEVSERHGFEILYELPDEVGYEMVRQPHKNERTA